METYFHDEPRIEEWINQIAEKILTVCLLTGKDSETEFYEGSLIVTKVAKLLMGYSTFPSEYLEDGVRQLIEQQLPDPRVSNNFPTFQDTMNKMITEGILSAKETLVKGDEGVREEVLVKSSKVVPMGEESDTFTVEETRDVVTPVDRNVVITEDIKVSTYKDYPEDLGITSSNNLASIGNHKMELSKVSSRFQSQTDGSKNIDQGSEQTEQLQHVLNIIFPKKDITWNRNLLGHLFLAQVEDTLIYVEDPNQTINMPTFNKEGWKVVICAKEDLKFPRRLERSIRQSRRIGKKA